jgi:microcystin-dependent protein
MIPSEEKLLLHFPCDAMEGDLLKDTSSGGNHAALPAGVQLRPDPELGRALSFASTATGLAVKLPELPEWALTLALWIRPDSATAAREFASLLQYPIIQTTQPDPDFVFGFYLAAGKLHARIGPKHAGDTQPVIAADQWQHVALVWDGATKQAVYYLDGQPVPAIVDGASVPAIDTGAGVLNYPDRSLSLLVATAAAGSETYSGSMAGIRVYARALLPEEIAALADKQSKIDSLPFDYLHPLDFVLADYHGHSSIYILDDSDHGRQLNLSLKNATPFAIEFPPSLGKEAQSAYPPGGELPSPGAHHLELLFRPGTLDPQELGRIAPVDTDWRVHAVTNPDSTVSLFLWRDGGLVLPPQGFITISLAHVRAALPGGSRSAQVELRYQHLRYLDDPGELSSHRLTHLDVVNQRGRSDSPLTAGFIGSNTVLNDGLTRNSLTLFLGNPSLSPLDLTPGELQVPPRLLLSFDSGQLNDLDEPWALGHADEIAEIEVSANAQDWVIHREEEGETPTWTILPPAREITSNAWINLTLYPIVTRNPSGFASLYLRYQNITGYRDGQITVLIEKAPRLYRQRPVPTAANQAREPDTRRSVHAFADSVVIGNDYAKASADGLPDAPPYPEQNTLLVQGKVGIGANNPRTRLELRVASADGLRITGPGGTGSSVDLDLTTYDPGDNAPSARIRAVDSDYSSFIEFQSKIPGAITNGLETRMVIDPNGNLTVHGSISDKDGLVVPIGAIIMWSNFRGQAMPAGWALCDGNNGTPDLRGRFIVGYSPEGAPNSGSGNANIRNDDCNAIGNNGGEKTHQLIASEMLGHTHTASVSPNGAHRHHLQRNFGPDLGYDWGGDSGINSISAAADHDHPAELTTTLEPAHTHDVTIAPAGDSQPHQNLPPYYVLAFIIKVS